MLTYLETSEWEIGIDEVGRGCLLGPVVACALVLPEPTMIQKHIDRWSQVKDSKKLSERKRKELHEFIIQQVPSYGIGMVFEKDIDSLNILRATMKAMHSALDNAIRPLSDKKHVKSPILHLMVDGPHFKPYIPPGEEEEWTVKKECIVDGDATYLSIAGASIVAKYTRDMYMQQLVKEHPMLEIYGISKNKGYGTQQHMTALKEQGRTQFHRVSFRPVKEAPIHSSLQNVLSS